MRVRCWLSVAHFYLSLIDGLLWATRVKQPRSLMWTAIISQSTIGMLRAKLSFSLLIHISLKETWPRAYRWASIAVTD